MPRWRIFPISNYLEVPNLGSIDHGHLKHRHNLSSPATEDNSSQALNKVAEQFEAIFIDLMRQSRQSKLSEGLFDNKTDDNFQQMLDQELANKSSSSVDIGIATSIVRQMSRIGT